MRINLKACLTGLCFIVAVMTVISSYWTKCSVNDSVSTTFRVKEDGRVSEGRLSSE